MFLVRHDRFLSGRGLDDRLSVCYWLYSDSFGVEWIYFDSTQRCHLESKTVLPAKLPEQ